MNQDQLLSDLSQPEKTLKRFLIVVSEGSKFKDDAHLAITAYATSYDSDPDLFIVKVSLHILQKTFRP